MDIIKELESLSEFDEKLFKSVIERVTVLLIVEVEFQFKSVVKVREFL